jgi:hypothetical protein
MKTELMEIYTCEFCSKYYKQKHRCLNHEKLCKSNPENQRKCISCTHLEQKSDRIEGSGETLDFEVKLLYCKAKEHFVYSPQCDIKGNVIDIGEINVVMPKECDQFGDYVDNLSYGDVI